MLETTPGGPRELHVAAGMPVESPVPSAPDHTSIRRARLGASPGQVERKRMWWGETMILKTLCLYTDETSVQSTTAASASRQRAY